MNEQKLISAVAEMKREAEDAKSSRTEQTKKNFDIYHMKQDWSYKKKGQSREFLPKQSMAVEQIANFMQQGLVDLGDWFDVSPEEGIREADLKIKPSEIQRIVNRQLEKMNIITWTENAVKAGLLGSLMIAKVRGEYVVKPRYVAKKRFKGFTTERYVEKIEDKVWQLKVDLVNPDNFFPDPTGRGMYEIEEIYMDFCDVAALSQGKNAIYDPAVVAMLKKSATDEATDEQMDKNQKTGQDTTNQAYRNRIKLTELWGNILDPVSGEMVHENVVMTIANDLYVIQPPTPNSNWHQESPYVVATILNVPWSVWGKALMDAPTELNKVINEFFNLIIDGGLMGVHGIKQIRTDWLIDPSQVENGIGAGDTIQVSSSCPPGQKVLERVDTSSVPNESLNIYNLVQQELNTSAMTNDLRMGAMPYRAVKATEVVEANQSITGMFQGMVKKYEQNFMSQVLRKAWMTTAQNINDLDQPWLESLIGKERAKVIRGMDNTEIFAETVNGCKFRVFGMSMNLKKQKDFTKLTALIQTISAVPFLLEQLVKKYDIGKLFDEIMKSLDIDLWKIENVETKLEQAGQLNAEPEANEPDQGQVQGPDMQSQITQAGAASNQGDQTMMGQLQANANGGMQ